MRMDPATPSRAFTRRTLLRGAGALGGALAVPFLSASTAAAAPPPDTVQLPDGWWPESITTGRGTTVYTGSLADGAIWQADVHTGKGRLLVAGTPGLLSVGVEYDTARDWLWVTNGYLGTVSVYAVATGSLLGRYQFDAGFLNDLVVTSSGVYVTDHARPQLAVIPLTAAKTLPAAGATRLLPLTGDFHQVPGDDVANANGIIAAKGGAVLLIVNSATGELFTVSPDTGVTRKINVTGAELVGGDGMEWRGTTLYIARGATYSGVTSVKLNGALTSGQVRDEFAGQVDIPTGVALCAGRLWVVNARFDVPNTPDTTYWITQLTEA